MSRTRLRLAGFAVVLAALFTVGYAVGDQFPVDDNDSDGTELHDDMEHGADVDRGVTP